MQLALALASFPQAWESTLLHFLASLYLFLCSVMSVCLLLSLSPASIAALHLFCICLSLLMRSPIHILVPLKKEKKWTQKPSTLSPSSSLSAIVQISNVVCLSWYRSVIASFYRLPPIVYRLSFIVVYRLSALVLGDKLDWPFFPSLTGKVGMFFSFTSSHSLHSSSRPLHLFFLTHPSSLWIYSWQKIKQRFKFFSVPLRSIRNGSTEWSMDIKLLLCPNAQRHLTRAPTPPLPPSGAGMYSSSLPWIRRSLLSLTPKIAHSAWRTIAVPFHIHIHIHLGIT